MSKPDKYELISDLARRRGFFWPSFEIYGGVGGFMDLGPLGVLMMRKIEQRWLDFFVRKHGFLEISTPIIMPEKVFRASGHVEHFKDPMVGCLACGRRFRADHVIGEAMGSGKPPSLESLGLDQLGAIIQESNIRCPECGGGLSPPEYFSGMFRTNIGPYSDAVGYARPEAAQGMFIDFKRVHEIARGQLPIAVAQIGRVMRNEISPRQGPIRLREFTIMEFEFFYDPEDPSCPYLDRVADEVLPLVPAELRMKGVEETLDVIVLEALKRRYILSEWSAYFMALSKRFLMELGVPSEKQRFHEKVPGERAHYSIQTYDHEVWTDRFGWVEVAGHANRTDYDLTGHIRYSGEDLTVFKPYDEPIVKKVKKLVPIKSALGQIFGDRADEVASLIESSDAAAIESDFRTKGYYEVAGLKVLPEQVEIREVEIKETGRRFVPHIVEPSYGAERLLYVALEYAYSTVGDRKVLKLPLQIAPIQAAIFPLITKDGLPEKAMQVYIMLRDEGFDVEYDESGSIGRRYARADEKGVPIAITVDYQTLRDDTVTLRSRDTWKQVRSRIDVLAESLRRYLAGRLPFSDLGIPVES